MDRCRGVSLSSRPQRGSAGTQRSRKIKEQRTNTKRKAGNFWAVSSVCGTFSAASGFGGTFLAVSRVGGTFLAEAVKPKYGGIFSAIMQYGGDVLAVGGFSFFGGNTLAVGGIIKIWR